MVGNGQAEGQRQVDASTCSGGATGAYIWRYDSGYPFTTVLNERCFPDKLERIRGISSTQTLRKAAITREQLGRRYVLFSEAHNSTDPNSFNLLKAARWYQSLNNSGKQVIETAEPFSWLKHLEKTSQAKERSSWHLTALILEEYLHSCTESSSSIPPIPEHVTHLSQSFQSRSRSSSLANSSTLLPSHDSVSFGPQRDSAESEKRRHKANIDASPNPPLTSSTSSPFSRTNVSPRQYHQGYTKDDLASLAGSTSDASEDDLAKSSAFVQSAPRKSEHPNPPVQVVVSQEPQEKVDQIIAAVPLQIKLSTSTTTSYPEPLSLSKETSPAQSKAPLPRRIRVSYRSRDAFRRLPEDSDVSVRREYDARAR